MANEERNTTMRVRVVEPVFGAWDWPLGAHANAVHSLHN